MLLPCPSRKNTTQKAPTSLDGRSYSSTKTSHSAARFTATPCCTAISLLFFASLCLFLPGADASVYANNETYTSLPALFGRYIPESQFYQVRLQYLHENPYLCAVDERTRQAFVTPPIVLDPSQDLHLPNASIALLVGRGNCSFQQKARMAESIDPSIEFLIVYNYRHSEEEDEDVLVPMYSEGVSRLGLVSVAHSAGQSLKAWLANQSEAVNTLGGPFIRIDGAPPQDITQASIDSMIFSALGMFFMLTSFAGCIVILAGTYGQLANGEPHAILSNRLLTCAEVHQLKDMNGSSRHHQHDSQCAVCIDDFEEDSEITILPCAHAFHSDCIIPWLTERQSKCPLCKFDVLEHIRERDDSSVSLWERAFQLQRNYYQWTSIQVDDDMDDDEGDDGILVDARTGVEMM